MIIGNLFLKTTTKNCYFYSTNICLHNLVLVIRVDSVQRSTQKTVDLTYIFM